MAVAGSLIGGAIGAFGRKPEIPQLPGIDPSRIQAETISANRDSLPGLETIANQVNSFNTQQNLGMLSKALEFLAPGQLKQVQDLNASRLRGEVPADVAAAVQRRSSAQAILGGYGGGSGIGRNLSARDFGRTSMEIQDSGIAGVGFLAGLAPETPLFDMSSMFFTPQQRLQSAFEERSQQFQRNLLAEQVAAAPDPATAALGKEIDRFFNTAASVGMSYAGMGGG